MIVIGVDPHKQTHTAAAVDRTRSQLLSGILAAVAIPNFLKFQSRAKQAEAKSNLRTWFTTQRSSVDVTFSNLP